MKNEKETKAAYEELKTAARALVAAAERMVAASPDEGGVLIIRGLCSGVCAVLLDPFSWNLVLPTFAKAGADASRAMLARRCPEKSPKAETTN